MPKKSLGAIKAAVKSALSSFADSPVKPVVRCAMKGKPRAVKYKKLAATRDAQFKALADRRKLLGLPVAGSKGDKSALSILRIGGKKFQGINSSSQNPKTKITLKRVNAYTITHAEADVVQKAV